MAPPLLTIGHGTSSQQELLDRVRSAGIELVVDVRTAPGSPRLPHVQRAALESWLPAGGIEYRWERRLGGFRSLPAGSPDVAIRNDSFRGYAAHTRTPEFAAAVRELVGDVEARGVAVMCAESLWWRCHRRMIADQVVLVCGVEVRHVLPDGSLAPHRPMEGVRVRPDGLLVYDAGQPPLPE